MAKGRLSGKLAVILHADVAGSTALVQQNEQLAHGRIQETFKRFSGCIEKYLGKVIELRGDALLAEFNRPSDAVCAAVSFQADQAYHNSRIKDDLVPKVRVGIAMGEVIVDDNTVTGAGVVLAQRVEQQAVPGGLCITEALHEALPKRMPFDLENLGEQVLKGFDDPVCVYRVELKPGESIPPPQESSLLDASPKSRKLMVTVIAITLIMAGVTAYWFKSRVPQVEPAVIERMVPPLPDKPSIAVLPFTNMSGDPDQEYFSDGMTEDLITDLSKVSGLTVIARSSTFSYKGLSRDISTIAKELNARYVVEGSVRKVGDKVRINVQLIDTANAVHLWANRYDRKMKEVFSMQDEVMNRIVSALSITLTEDEESRFQRVYEPAPAAYDTLLKGLKQFRLFTRESNIQSRELFKRAIELDPLYARAYANAAMSFSQAVAFGWSPEPDTDLSVAMDFAQKGLNVDETSPQVHFALSTVYIRKKMHKEAIAAARRSVQLNPNFADGFMMLAQHLIYAGEPEEGLQAITTAKQLNPHHSFIYFWFEALAHFLLGNYEKAAMLGNSAIERNPEFPASHLALAAIYGQMGDIERAEWEAQEVLSLLTDFTITKERTLRAPFFKAQHLNLYLDGLRKAGLPE